MDGEQRGREEERRRELIQRLLGPAVHRLNNSMAVISGLTALLQQRELDPARRKQFESVAEQSNEATALIRELGQLPIVRSASAETAADIALADVLGRLGTLLAPFCRSLRVEFDAPEPHAPELRRTVRATATALVHRLATLAGALLPRERLPVAGAILGLRVRDVPAGVELELDYRSPNGDPPIDVPACEELARESRGQAESWGGGLALRGDATRLVATWRLVCSGASDSGAEAAQPAAVARILVLESDAQLGSLIGDVLADVGHEVRVLSDSATLEAAAGEAWDLVMFDSGFAAGAPEQAFGASTPAVRMCGHGTDVDPGEQVLLKPFRPKELIECVRAALGADFR